MNSNEPWTSLKLIAWTQNYLSERGVENARLESEWLLCAATGLDRVGLYLNFEKPLVADELTKFRDFVVRRGKREPLQHILGTEEFCGYDFIVTPDVLIPRHDTEVLIEEALRFMPNAATILDIGTGTGCLAITLKKKIRNSKVFAVDISEKSLSIAKLNAQRLAADINFLFGSLFEPVEAKTFDLIVSNPPYIPTADIETLEPEVRDYDPKIALDGGIDGLEIYAKLIPEALKHLNTGGWCLVEIGIGQSDAVTNIFYKSAGYGETVSAVDRGGVVRVVGAKKII